MLSKERQHAMLEERQCVTFPLPFLYGGLKPRGRRALGTLDIASIYLPRYFCVLSLFTSQ